MLPVATYRILKLYLASGICPFDEWYLELSDAEQLMVESRLTRIAVGNFGECRSLKGGLYEIKFREGRGLRIYYGRTGGEVILLIVGGDKRRQEKDIDLARTYWNAYRRAK